MTGVLAFLGDFGGAVDFIFHSRESQAGGSRIGGAENLPLLWKHLEVVGLSMAAAIIVALPLGLLLGHTGRAAFLAISTSNVGRAVPSVALIAFFYAFLPSVAELILVVGALALLAIPPILTNTYVGVRQVSREAVDAARGMGMSEAQIVRRVELPLAVRSIFGGIQLSAISVVATAILGPLASVDTLGTPIVSVNVYGQAGLLGAAILVAVLAVLVYVILTAVQRAVTPRGLKVGREPPALRRRIPFLDRRSAHPT
jgi:osmoprotectant transport system permease protein